MKTIKIFAVLLSCCISAHADNTLKRNLKRKSVETVESTELKQDTLRTVIGEVRLAGYEKPLRSSHESIFITNNDERILKCVVLNIEYLDEQGRQLHQREIEIECEVPSGETRQLTFPSWDKQKTTYYYLSPKARTSNGTPYRVKSRPVLLIYEKGE